MNKKNILEFKQACGAYLSTVSLNALRSYGRSLQLKAPTATRKDELIKEIIRILCGEAKPQRNKKGAPIKSDYVDPRLIEKINFLKKEYFLDGVTEACAISVSNSVSLQLSINPSALTNKQKQLLNDFLNSL